MNWTEDFSVSPEKIAALRARITRLGIQLAEIQESFSRGGGKGGQKINKTSNRVVLRYPAYGLVISMQQDRRRAVNRFLALRELVDQVERRISPETSDRVAAWERIRRQKNRRRRRSKEPPAAPA